MDREQFLRQVRFRVEGGPDTSPGQAVLMTFDQLIASIRYMALGPDDEDPDVYSEGSSLVIEYIPFLEVTLDADEKADFAERLKRANV